MHPCAAVLLLLGLPVTEARSATINLGGKEYELHPPADDVMAIITNITNYSGMAMNFDVWKLDGLSNAIAMLGTLNGKKMRVMVYGAAFLDGLAEKAGSGWAKVAVLAHEIGHHANGHFNLDAGTPALSQEQELQADEHAGWLLAMMGAPLTECLRMWDYLPDPHNLAVSTHPTKAKRKEAVSKGWYAAQHIKTNKNPAPDFGTSCPIIKLETPGIDLRRYQGTIGTRKANIALMWGLDKTISGHCDLTDEKGVSVHFDLKGWKESMKGLAVLDKLHLDQFRGCLVVGQVEADVRLSLGYENLEGKVKNSDGTEEKVSLRCTLPLSSSTYYGKLPGWRKLPPELFPPKDATDWSKMLKDFPPARNTLYPKPLVGIDLKLKLPPPIDWAKILNRPSVPTPYFPPPKADKARPARISTVGGYDGVWFCVASTGTPYTEQVMITKTAGMPTSSNLGFPTDLINSNVAKGYHVSHLAGDGGGWSAIMSRGGTITDQKIIGPRKLPPLSSLENEIREHYVAGYRITAVAGFMDSWVIVQSRGTKVDEQVINQANKEWPEAWVREHQGRGYRITAMAGSGQEDPNPCSWFLVMSRNSGLGEQIWSSGKDFPRAWISENWDAGYRITSASGYNGWRVVMSRDSGLDSQSYPPVSRDFPLNYVYKEWAGER